MGETESGFRKGFGQGAGCCAFAVFVPVAIVGLVLASLQPGSQKRQVRVVTQEQRREETKIAALKLEREAKHRAGGLESVPDVAVSSEAEMRKQMRVEGVSPKQDIVTFFQDADAKGEAVRPLVEAAKLAKAGRADDVQILEEFSGVKKGDLISDVMLQFDAPEHRGETNAVLKYSQGWPDKMYYSYHAADVTFIVDNLKVDVILVGLAYYEALR